MTDKQKRRPWYTKVDKIKPYSQREGIGRPAKPVPVATMDANGLRGEVLELARKLGPDVLGVLLSKTIKQHALRERMADVQAEIAQSQKD
ncbi:MAG: hypothetical protein ACRC1W_14965 [Shewanella sp.]